MKKSQEIIGLPVFSIVDGRKIGQVKDLVINPEEGKVEFILVSNANWYVGARVLPYKVVLGVGEHAVTTESESQLSNINETSSANGLLERNIEVKGNRVLTNLGNLVGVISEYEIDETSGKITSLEYKSAQDENKIETVKAMNVITYGTDVIVIKGVESVQGETKIKEQIEEKKVTTPSNETEATSQFKDRQKQFMLGKKVNRDILDPNGKVIISEGTIVNEDIIQFAEVNGKFVELSQCVK